MKKSSELMFWGFFHIIQATAYYKVLLSKYSFIVSQQKSELSVHWSRQITCQTISR